MQLSATSKSGLLTLYMGISKGQWPSVSGIKKYSE